MGVACDFNVANYSVNDFEYYAVHRDSSLQSAVDQRCAEFLAGRYVAAQALKALSANTDRETHVGVGELRSPIWPNGVVGSISHSREFAVAFVGSTTTCLGAGVDVEAIMPETTCEEVHDELMNADEIGLATSVNIPYATWVTAVFAAKEAFFKAAFPSVKRYFGFDAVSVLSIHGDHWQQGVRITVRVNAELELPFHRHAEFDVSVCVLPNQHVMAVLVV